jgi:predicted porin
VDLILGASYKIKNVQVALGYQQPLSQNRNQFSSENIIGTFEKYQTTRNYKRAGDVMLRVSYPFEFNKFKITPSVLPIYHLSNDLYTDATNVEREISGSQGLTINGNVYFDYKLNNKNAFQFNFGMPFVTRIARPDGLTRSWIATLEYAFSF